VSVNVDVSQIQIKVASGIGIQDPEQVCHICVLAMCWPRMEH
jgi:hypothetical protein